LRILCPRAHWLAAQKARFGGPFALLARCRTLNRSAPGAQLALCAAPLIKFGSQKPGARALKPAICDPNFGEWDRGRLGNGGSGIGWVVGRGSWVWAWVCVGSGIVGRGSGSGSVGPGAVDRSRAAERPSMRRARITRAEAA